MLEPAAARARLVEGAEINIAVRAKHGRRCAIVSQRSILPRHRVDGHDIAHRGQRRAIELQQVACAKGLGVHGNVDRCAVGADGWSAVLNGLGHRRISGCRRRRDKTPDTAGRNPCDAAGPQRRQRRSARDFVAEINVAGQVGRDRRVDVDVAVQRAVVKAELRRRRAALSGMHIEPIDAPIRAGIVKQPRGRERRSIRREPRAGIRRHDIIARGRPELRAVGATERRDLKTARRGRLHGDDNRIALRDHRRAVMRQQISLRILRIKIDRQLPADPGERLRSDLRQGDVLSILGKPAPQKTLCRGGAAQKQN